MCYSVLQKLLDGLHVISIHSISTTLQNVANQRNPHFMIVIRQQVSCLHLLNNFLVGQLDIIYIRYSRIGLDIAVIERKQPLSGIIE
jgi:hypothetical protein